MKYYLIAGEKSGDLHASNLIKSLKKRDANAEFRGWGGDEMEAAGLTLVKHYKETAFMGFLEVFLNLHKISGFIKSCKKDITSWKPDVIILVDYAGFNLRIAKFAKTAGFKVYYYISPKLWAWGQKRALKIKKYVDRMFAIMHFEKAFYAKFDYHHVDYVGNPVLDAVSNFSPAPNFLIDHKLENKRIIAILPGSRKQEVINILHKTISLKKAFPEHQFVIAGVSQLPKELYSIAKENEIPVLFDQTYDLLSHAEAAIVTSGTATLETAMFYVPEVVVYQTSTITYNIAKIIIKVKYISLVNLLADKEVVKELIQNDFNEENLIKELTKVIENKDQIINEYKSLYKKLKTESVSETAAELMTKYLH
ncbi:lipid-A-disaccharide synthase [Chondrinema litorale]|uniref:lipid-A-disaccharide synthase n=1 Tax=Chondrinema litorale TaxID=2994555 RepID=UPI002543E645|nr:lipid-A-disaccharide synthase [Chondrinema litorale]UZR94006.1 lipid-A-disaccharide synthase [Chondrinema litorale]